VEQQRAHLFGVVELRQDRLRLARLDVAEQVRRFVGFHLVDDAHHVVFGQAGSQPRRVFVFQVFEDVRRNVGFEVREQRNLIFVVQVFEDFRLIDRF